MLKSYAYQISNLVALKKTCKSTTWPPKTNQHEQNSKQSDLWGN